MSSDQNKQQEPPERIWQGVDINGTYMVIERRPRDVRFRLEARGGYETLFYLAGDWPQQITSALSPDLAQPLLPDQQKIADDVTTADHHFRFAPCVHSMMKPDCASCLQGHASRAEKQLKKLKHSTALPVRERIEKALREHMAHCYAVYKGVPHTVEDWIGGALHYVMWGIEQDLPMVEPACKCPAPGIGKEYKCDDLQGTKFPSHCNCKCHKIDDVNFAPPDPPDAAPTDGGAEGEAHCWHCGVAVVGVPRPRCEGCPAECDIENCDAFGCRAPSPSVSPIATAEQTAREIVRVAHNITRDCLSRTCFRVDCSRKDCWGCDGFNAAVERVAAIQSSVATGSPGTEPWFDAGGCAWEIRRGVDCVECPHCAFTFAAVHTSGDSNGYECPACEGCPDDVLVVSPDTEAQARDKDTTEAEAIASYYPNVKGSEKIALVEDIKDALTTARRETALHSRFAAGVQACVEAIKEREQENRNKTRAWQFEEYRFRMWEDKDITTALSAIAAGDSLREKSTANDSRARDSHGDSTPVGDQSSGVGTDGGQE